MQSPPSTPPAGKDWPSQLAGRLESLTSKVEGRTVGALRRAARAIVYGLVAAVVVQIAAVLLSIALVRLFNVYVFAQRDWASLFLVGGILVLFGLLLWALRRPRKK